MQPTKILFSGIQFYIYVLSVVSLISSCASSIIPDAPLNSISELTLKTQPLSRISIPIKLNLKPYFDEADSAIPVHFSGAEKKCEGISYSYRFYRDPIKFNGFNDHIRFVVDGSYSLKLNYCPKCMDLFDKKGNCIIPRVYSSCGVDEPLRKLEVGYSTQIKFTKEYRLNSTTKLSKVKTVSPCIVTVFNYDASTTLKEEVTKSLQELENEIDTEISSIDLRPTIEEAWEELLKPTDLEGYGFLNMNPKSVSMSELKFKGDSAYFNAVIEAKPIIQSTNNVVDSSPLPNLTDYNNTKGFDITTDYYSTYDSLSSIITNQLSGISFEVKRNEIVFGEIKVIGAADMKIHIEVTFSGDKKGVMYFTGTPYFDSTSQTISLPDLTFDLSTKNVLLKSAKWLFNEKITLKIREAATIELAPYLDSLLVSINKNINSELADGIFLSGKVETIRINQIQPLINKLFMRFNTIGDIVISM